MADFDEKKRRDILARSSVHEDSVKRMMLDTPNFMADILTKDDRELGEWAAEHPALLRTLLCVLWNGLLRERQELDAAFEDDE